ncbi:MAG: nitronate monooxygenase [Gammaproteobacteria bacterium]|nr:nitronate monooxygenase [Gammaproteobacteria bacterium]
MAAKPNRLLAHTGITTPIICGAMYPCSNPELVAAVSEAGGIGIVQPISLTYVHGYDFREGIRAIRKLTDKPIGMNALIEQSSKRYHRRMQEWVDIALEEGIRFFVTSLGKPGWVAERVHAAGGLVYHDTTNRKFALKGLEGGVDGLICVNNRAGGHTGQKSAAQLYEELADLNVPLICAGGISTVDDYQHAMQLGYEGVQMGTAFIATTECSASDAYKQAIIDSQEEDIVLSERITGVPVSVINTASIKDMGTRAGPIAQWLLKGAKTKHLMRMFYTLRSIINLKKALQDKTGKRDFWQAGKGVAGVTKVRAAGEIIKDLISTDERG